MSHVGVCESLPDGLFYVDGAYSPEVWVVRGRSYKLRARGGSANPLYITSEETGGWVDKPASEQAVCTKSNRRSTEAI